MKKILKNKKGIMGIDYICVAGVVITLTVYILINFYNSGILIADNALDQLNLNKNININYDDSTSNEYEYELV